MLELVFEVFWNTTKQFHIEHLAKRGRFEAWMSLF